MAKKYYAVKSGLTRGIYLTWEDCRKNVEGFEGAVYKSFASVEEAAAFLEGTSGMSAGTEEPVDMGAGTEEPVDMSTGTEEVIAPAMAEDIPEMAPGEAVAYVDGSYNVATKEYACGVVLFHDGRTETFSKRFADPDRAEMRNVAGEIEGSMCAMNYCLEHDIRELTIYYDYAGVEHWCTGAWKANKEGTRAYRDYYEKVSQRVRIHFVKVKGHSGDKYNDMADKLAKQAIGLA